MANIFRKRCSSEKLEVDLASMRKRVDVLAAKRAQAKAVFDQAVSERQSFLLEGDLSDERAGNRVQKAVDAAASRVTGFDGALLALQTQLDDVEMKLRAENEAVERERVASEVEATIKDIEARLQPWLENTRAFIAALAPLDHLSFETQQCREFIAKLAVEVELALAVHLPDLRRYATRHHAERWSDVELLVRLVPRASQKGAIAPLSDARKERSQGNARKFHCAGAYGCRSEFRSYCRRAILPPGFERLPAGAERILSYREPRR